MVMMVFVTMMTAKRHSVFVPGWPKPGTVLRALIASDPCNSYDIGPMLATYSDENTEAWGSSETCPSSGSQEVEEPGTC